MARMVSVEVMMGLASGILEKCVVIGHDRSLAKGLKTVNESRDSHVCEIAPTLNSTYLRRNKRKQPGRHFLGHG